MSKMTDDQFIDEIRQRLDKSIAQLQPSVTQRLQDMRRQAMDPERVSNSDPQQELLLNVQQKLDDSEALAPEIEARLDQIRQQAVTQLKSSATPVNDSLLNRVQELVEPLFANHKLAMPASVFATACVMVTVVSLFYVSSRPPGSLPLEDEISLIASADDIELYENLEFYLWLAENGVQ